MSNLLKSKFFLGTLVVAVMFVGAVAVKATPASADCAVTVTLKLGSKGVEVQCLQGKVGTNPDGSFGPMTLAAVKAFQTSKGLTADGIVGPMTRAALNGSVSGNFPAGCTSASGYSTTTGLPCTSGPSTGLPAGCSSTAGYSPTTGKKCDSTTTTPSTGGPLTGGAGSITIEANSSYSSEEVGEGEEDVEIISFDVEADDESDVEVTSVKVEFFQGTAADSENLDDYAESVSIWMGSTKVGEADVDSFSENSDVWSKSVSLDGAIVRKGDTEEFTVAVSALSNLDSGDIDTDVWYGGVSNVRFEDAEGVVTTETLTLDVDEEIVDDTVEETFDFADFATASDAELKVALDSAEDDINDAHVINVDASDDTDDVEVLAFTLEAEGDSDINVTEIPVLITTTGETDEAVIVVEAKLWMDGEEIATEDVPTGGAVTFDDLDIDIEAGDEVKFTVSVSLQDVGGVLDDGDTVKVELTGTEVDAIEAEDESGEELGAADLTGTAAGEAHATYDVGFNIELVSATESKQSSDTATVGDIGTFVIKYKVTAFDGDIAIDNTCVEDNDGSEVSTATSFSITNPGSNTASCTTTSTGDTQGGVAFLIEEGTSETITLTVSAVATGDAFAQVALEAIGWGLSGAGGDDFVFDFDLPGDYKTDPVFLNLP